MRWFAISTLCLFALAGCATSTNHTGSLSIYVKDAPTDEFDEIHIVFHQIQVHAAGNETENGTWLTVYENTTGFDVDLLDAQGARAAFLGEANLSAGKYTQIRIHVTQAYGVQGNSTVPIALSNGILKVVRSFDVEADQETRLVLDFDLDRALKETGQGWRMTPVIGKTFVHQVDDAQSGGEVHAEGEVAELEGVE